jgi:hypothetical protein
VILVDTMMASGLRWLLLTIAQAAQAELEDDTPLREALVEAGVRLELGEISPEQFALLEDQLLARIRAKRDRDAVETGPIAFPAAASQAADETLAVEAAVTGDFHEPAPSALRSERARRKRRSEAPAA